VLQGKLRTVRRVARRHYRVGGCGLYVHLRWTVLYFDDNGSTSYLKREVVEKRREKGAAVVAEAAE
jgi:hypothetical protein